MMLFWLSFGSLLLELICIRWLSVEINLFAHLRNFLKVTQNKYDVISYSLLEISI